MAPNKPFILFFIALLLFTTQRLKQLHDEFQNALFTYPKLETKPEWLDTIFQNITHKNINIGFVNMEMIEVHTKGIKTVNVHFDPIDKDIHWSNLYPDWIDENSPGKCPEIPMPKLEKYKDLDVVVARIPCKENGSLRDVFRLQLNLVVANLLVRSGRREVFAVFIGWCGPMLEIFRCDDLLWHHGNYWIYKPQLGRIKQKLLMPVGSCQLCPPFPPSGEELWRRETAERREAYVTILHSSEAYVCGAIALAHSIIRSNSTKDLLLLADHHISSNSLNALRSAGWKIKSVRRIRNPHSKKHAYNEWNYTKLRLWQLTKYHKLMFVDSDLILTRNLDHFFFYPQISAVQNENHIFNSGLMLLEPSTCTFKTLMEKRWAVRSYNGGDQGFLNDMFPWWHRLPRKINRLKFFYYDTDQEHRISDDVYGVHYLGLKPWMCYKDYDCNWDKKETRRFASDSANDKWWSVYDSMSEEMKKYCSLSREMNARIVENRVRAKKGRFRDGHWKIKVKDPRQNITM
ncbi:hypothetical protein ACS0TY_016413 [Phlomoides rotata]